MREFVKLSPKFWVGPTGRAIRQAGVEAQIVALYAMSSPHTNYVGLYRLPLVYIASDTGLDLDTVRAALATLERVGFARYDEASETVWVVEAAKWQVGEAITEGDKRVTMLRREFAEVPSDCPFKSEFLAKYAVAYHLTAARTAKVSQPRAGMSHPDAVKSAADSAAEQAAKAELAAKNERAERERLMLLSELERFQAARDSAGISSPAEDKRVAAYVLSLAAAKTSLYACDALAYAVDTGDYALAELESREAAMAQTVAAMKRAHRAATEDADI